MSLAVLHLGVTDIPYGNDPARTRVAKATKGKNAKPRKAKASPGSITTGDVATILESEYGIMQYFYDEHAPEIAKSFEKSIAGALENIMSGQPPSNNPFGSAEMAIEDSFRAFLDNREMDNKVSGVPTAAAERGVNPRLAHPYAKANPARPSFIASGHYQSSFKAWVDV